MRRSHKTKKVEEKEETEDSGNETLSESTVVLATGSYRRLVKYNVKAGHARTLPRQR